MLHRLTGGRPLHEAQKYDLPQLMARKAFPPVKGATNPVAAAQLAWQSRAWQRPVDQHPPPEPPPPPRVSLKAGTQWRIHT